MFRLVADNATGETKNQTILKFLAKLVFDDIFRCADLQSLRTGHTHNSQDLGFSVGATAIARGDRILQDKNDFVKVLAKDVVRELVVGTLRGTCVSLSRVGPDACK